MSTDGEAEKSPGQRALEHTEWAAEDFRESCMTGLQMSGPVGFHRYYRPSDREDLVAAVEVAMLQAFEDATEEVWIDREEVARRHGDVTPETVARETREQVREFGPFYDGWILDRFEENVRDYLQDERRRLQCGFYEFDEDPPDRRGTENTRLSSFEDTEEDE